MNWTVIPEKPAALILALALDLGAGEPPAPIHPVVGVGKLVEFFVRWTPNGPRRELAYGAMCAGVVTLGPALGTGLLLRAAGSGPLRLVAGAWLLKACFAYRALEEAARSVAGPLSGEDLPVAREALLALVSRDRSGLDASQVSAATIESLAENLSDGFVAPLLAYALGGLPAAVFYRAANTADSMISYRGRYEYLGKFAARLDDSLNLLPARLTALLILAASGADAGKARRIVARDHAKTPSPNAGWPMAAVAGALDVSLQKPDVYDLNETAREPDVEDIYRAIGLCRRVAALWVALVLAVMALCKRRAGCSGD
ncbi:MAG TPA: adenosylcobinamide-phosphate synthase CbiB [Rubrobacteraceae bacterium]|nr:adenosylcobinamide-phosphate synthase CbiB [Rubrobacteraceae bacterium]